MSTRTAVLLLCVLSSCSSYEPVPLAERQLLEQLRTMEVELPAEGLDPDQAVAVALTHNPQLKVLRREHEIAAELVLSADAWENPELRASLRNLYSRLTNPLGLVFDLRLFPSVPGEKDAKVARERALAQGVLDQIESLETRIAADTRSAHARVVLLEQEAALLDSGFEFQERIASLVQEKRQVGAATGIEAVLASFELEELRDERDSLAAERDAAIGELAVLLGVDPGRPLTVRPQTNPRPDSLAAAGLLNEGGEPGTLEELEDFALGARADLRLLASQYQVREQELRLAHLSHTPWPRFLQPSFGKTFPRGSYDDGSAGDWAFDLGTAVELPIFQTSSSEVAVANARREQARDRYLAFLHQVRGEIHQAVLALREADRRRRLHTERLGPLLEEAEALVQSALDTGGADLQRIGSLESRIVDARRAALSAEFRYREARIQLARATGAVRASGS